MDEHVDNGGVETRDLVKLLAREVIGQAGVHGVAYDLDEERIELFFDPTLKAYDKDLLVQLLDRASQIASPVPVVLVLAKSLRVAADF